MKRTRIDRNLYQDERGFLARIWTPTKRRSWRRLKAKTAKFAKIEAGKAAWSDRADRFSKLAEQYLESQCANKKLEPRPEAFCSGEKRRLVHLVDFFGRFAPAEIRIPLLLEYRKWRVKRLTRAGTGERSVDMEAQTLSNALSFAVAKGMLEINYIRSGRPRFRQERHVVHSRERAPTSIEEIHSILDSLFSDVRSESCAWLACYHYLTGCRTSELLRLRIDAKQGEPGYVHGSHLWLGRRSKGGVNPFVLIGPELADCMEHHRVWLRVRYPHNPFYFPTRKQGVPKALEKGSLAHSMARVCRELKIEGRTPHGLRSFFVTCRRSHGATDAQVAAEIGDKTVSLIQRTYGDLPPNWTGGAKMAWVPEQEKRAPAWQRG